MRINLIRYKMSSRCDLLFFLLYVCVYLFITAKCQLCEENSPSYLYSAVSITCKNVHGQFSGFTKAVSVLKCIDCNIPVLDENSMTLNFKGDSFNLSNSHITKISATAFTTFGNATHKFLFENNEISSISKKVFSNFSLLDEINLKKNNLSSFEDGTFEDTNTSVLDLSQNHLRNISGMFAGLRVTKLNLSSNEITEIPQNAFDQTTFWTGRQWRTGFQFIDLSNNFIFKIYPGTFKSPSSDNVLRSLYLQNNKISVIENNTFLEMSYLRLLSLEENYISELYTDSFKGLTSLTTLILKNNKLEKIPPSMFADLTHLELLDVSQNSITTLTMNTFSGLTYLTKLNISHNNLRELDDSHIFPLGKLISLDISDTKLKDLNLASILEHHYKLRVLVLNDNFWTCKNLVQMYKQMNERIGGFDYPSRHFDVPNLHGIACSRTELDSYNDITFDDFLGVISQDRVFEDLFDSRVTNEYGDVSFGDVADVFTHIRSIYYMMLVLTIVILILFLQFTVRCVFQYLYNRNIINSKYSFAYNSNQDNVELI